MRFRYYLRGIGLGILFATIVLTISVRVRGGIMTDERAVKRAEELGYVLPETENADTETGNSPDSEDVLQGSEVKGNDAQENAAQGDHVQGSDVQGNDSQENATQGDHVQGGDVQGNDSQENAAQGDHVQGGDVQGNDSQENAAQGDHVQVNDTQDISAVEDSQHDNADFGEFDESGNGQELITIIVKKGDNCRKLSERLFEAGLVADAEDFRLYMFQKKYDSLISAGTFEIPSGADYEQIAQILIKELRE